MRPCPTPPAPLVHPTGAVRPQAHTEAAGPTQPHRRRPREGPCDMCTTRLPSSLSLNQPSISPHHPRHHRPSSNLLRCPLPPIRTPPHRTVSRPGHTLQVLSLVNQSAALQDDAYSRAVAEAALAAVVPAWTSAGQGAGALWAQVAGALPTLPPNRRLAVLLALLRALPKVRKGRRPAAKGAHTRSCAWGSRWLVGEGGGRCAWRAWNATDVWYNANRTGQERGRWGERWNGQLMTQHR